MRDRAVSRVCKAVLLGRPNVGKSTLYNRLIRSNRAITHDRPGVTRDRMEGVVRARGEDDFFLVDTGGVTLGGHGRVEPGPAGIAGYEAAILDQVMDAVRESDLLCLIVDGRDGLTPFDRHLADFLRRRNMPLILVVNKVDGPEKEDILSAEFQELGLDMIACSAAHGFNIRTLEQMIRERLYPAQTDESPAGEGDPAQLPEPLRLCLLGRPNVGKSSLVNALAGACRMIVSEIAGTTRDSVDVCVEINGVPCTFVDTAGVRRRSKITDPVERYSVNSSIKSTTKADVTLLLLDAGEGLTLQDKRLINLLHERKIPFMLLINKSDLVEPKKRKEIEGLYLETLAFCPHVPVLFISVKNKHNLEKIVPLAQSIRRECGLRVPTGQLNRVMAQVLQRHQPPIVRNGRSKFFYLTQAESRPPTFVFFVNDADKISDAYARYLDRSLRELFGIRHAPMRLHFRSSHSKK